MPVERQPGDPLPEPYTNAAAVVAAELARLSLRLRLAVLERRAPASGAAGDDVQRELLRLETPPGKAARSDDPEAPRLQERLLQRTRRNQANREATRVPLPVYTLAERAGLDALGLDLFLLALAPEIDEGFGPVLAALSPQPAGTARRRALDLATAARVLTPDDVGAAALRLLLAPGAPLYDLGIIEVQSPGDGRERGVSLGATLQVPPPVIAYVLGQPVGDPSLRLFTRLWPAGPGAPTRASAFLPPDLFAHGAALLDDGTALPLLDGPPGVGKGRLCRVLLGERGQDLLEVDVRSAPESLSRAETLAIARLCFLRDATLLLRLPRVEPAAGPNKDDRRPAWQAGVLDLLSRCRGVGGAALGQSGGRARVLLSRDSTLLASGISDAGALDLPVPSPLRLSPLTLPAPEAETREALWRDRLTRPADATGRAGPMPVAADVDFAFLARSFPITAGVITRVADEARALARARVAPGEKAEKVEVARDDILRSMEAEFRPRLQTVGRRLTTRAKMTDLVLADETRETLAELEATVRLRHKVLDDWGFRKLVHGRGVSALFYGEPGTGKTLAAGVIAASCGLPLYQIDTAQVVSKWVGETEKNLAEVFRAAEAGHAMLLFDEADAIFGKRTDVQHSTDRFANMQTNFLLTQIESFNGVVVLTTNKESVMDPAFQRRLTFRVHFPMPEEKEREELWRRMLASQAGAKPGAAPPAERINYGDLARRLQMSGGYIRNAVLRAAYLAAASGGPLTTPLLRNAAELVLRDAGKVI